MTQRNLAHSLAAFSEPLLDCVLSEIFSTLPSAKICFLAECGSSIQEAAIRVLFHNLVIQDDARVLEDQSKYASGPISAFIRNPNRYAPAVRSITITDPTNFTPHVHSPPSVFSLDEDSSTEDLHKTLFNGDLEPIAASRLEGILRLTRNLDTFTWRANTLPPDGICEILSVHNPRLSSFIYVPESRILPASSTGFAFLKWDAPSLPMLSTLNITKLQVSRLSQTGARAFAHLLSLLEDDSTLDSASVDISWLDDGLCALIGKACRKVRRLQIGSEGTRLSDRGILNILEACEHLEEFSLVDAQGRLPKTLWSKVKELPPLLRRLRIAMSEHAIQHSWAIDHLSGLHALPLDGFTHLTVVRVVHPFDSSISELASIKPIPSSFVDSFKRALNLEVLECDWWSWRPEDLKVPLETGSSLRKLKVAFDAPFSKLLTMTSAFASATRLELLEVLIPEEHCPALPPSPSASVYTNVQGSTPGASPILLQKPLSSSLGASDSLMEDRPSPPRSSFATDPFLPPLRDVRKFVRRCAVLQELNWYGKNGRGQWIVARSMNFSTPSKISSNATVEHIPPSPATGHGLTSSMWERVRQEEEATRAGWTPALVIRDGAEWIGMNAKIYQAARAAEREKEEQAVKEEKAARAAAKRGSVAGADIALNTAKAARIEREPSDPSAGPRQEPPSPVSPYYTMKEPPSPSSPKLVRRRVLSSAATTPSGTTGDSLGRVRARSQGAAEMLMSVPTRVEPSKPPTSRHNGQGRGSRRSSGSSKSGVNGNGRSVGSNGPRRPSNTPAANGGGSPKNLPNTGDGNFGSRRASTNGTMSAGAGRGRLRKAAL